MSAAVVGELSRWRFASRLARREVKRRPGRTVLVVILVAIPVMGMTFGSVLARTLDREASFLRGFRLGTDIVVGQDFASDVDFSDRIPASAQTTTIVRGAVPLETAAGVTTDWVTISDGGANGLPGDVFSVDTGRAPGAGEVWLSNRLRSDLGVEVGDTLELLHPYGSWVVAGTGRSRVDFDERIMVVPDLPVEQFRSGVLTQFTLIDLGAGATSADIDAVGAGIETRFVSPDDEVGFVEWNDESADGDIEASPLAWGWVAGTIALAAMGIVIAAAFATSARRQLVTIGLLSSNGASDRLVRRTLALQGFWTGVAGSVVGIGVALTGLPAIRSTMEEIRGRVMTSYQVAVSDIVVIAITGIGAATIAAHIPARTASRVPVMAALAGRRPVGEVPRRLVPIGLGMFTLGVFLLVVAATSDAGNGAVAAGVLGGVSVLVGTCCASPLAVDAMSRGSSALGRSWRFAGRSLGRSRTRSAAVVTAIAVTGALALSGATLAMELDEGYGERSLPADAVAVVPLSDPSNAGEFVEYDIPRNEPVDGDTRQSIDSIVPGAEWHSRRIVAWDVAPFAQDVGSGGGTLLHPGQTIVVADAATMDLYELSAVDRRSLGDVGMLSLAGGFVAFSGARTTGESALSIGEVVLSTEDGDIMLPYGQRAEFRGIYGIDTFMITEAAAAEAGLEVVTSGGFLRSDAPLTQTQRRALNDLQFGPQDNLRDTYLDMPQTGAEQEWSFAYHWPLSPPRTTTVQAAIVAAALFLTLLVVAIGLSLAATESRDERDVLIAVGSRPVTMRSMAGVKAFVITFTGVSLAIPAGLIPMFAVVTALEDGFEMPWLAVGALLLVVPLVAGLAAWAVSAVAQRARPVRMSNLAFD